MRDTGRVHGTKRGTGKILASSVGDIAQQTRVEALRRTVAAGRYEVNPYKVAMKIFLRAMSRGA